MKSVQVEWAAKVLIRSSPVLSVILTHHLEYGWLGAFDSMGSGLQLGMVVFATTLARCFELHQNQLC